MNSAWSLRLLIFSVRKGLYRRVRDCNRGYCSAHASPTVTATEFKSKLSSGPGLTHFIKHSASHKSKVPEVCEHEEPYLPVHSADEYPRKGERTNSLTHVSTALTVLRTRLLSGVEE